ncbi:MAG: hypothetical protein ABIQ31_08340 [Ferruginibacter sp.]
MKYNGLPKHLSIIIWFSLVNSGAFSQLTGTKTIPGTYPTIAAAVTALNSAGVGSGGVIFNVAVNYTETISTTLSLTATGTAANPVTFQKDPSTTGANPLITAYTSGVGTPATATQDGIWRLSGSDYITIDGINLRDNPANTANPSTMEYGFAVYKASTANGCQSVTIKNCTITLNRLNNATGAGPVPEGSTGIIVMNTLATAAVTSLTPVAGGSNSNNKFYSNTIQNCNYGIVVIGYAAPSPFTLADTNNDIGGSSAATGNTIINYGGGTSATNPAAAIRTLAQQSLNVSYNVINNNNGSGVNHPGALRGIYINTATSAGTTITYNTITVKGGGTTQAVAAIENASGSTAASNTVNISNNIVTNCSYATSTTGGFYGIFNSATPAALNINNNTISNNSNAAINTGFLYGIFNSGAAATVTINSNIISGNSTKALTTGLFSGIYNSSATPALTITSNTISGSTTTATSGAYYAIYNSGAVTTAININSNNIGTGILPAITFSSANTANHNFIYNAAGTAAAALSISNNNIQGVTYAVAGSGANTFVINNATTLSQAINSNTFTNLNVNTTGNITFISNNVAVSASGSQNVNSNSIAGTFNKAGAGGTVTLFTSTATSLPGSVINNNNNNFSNITVTGATIIGGWINTDAGGSNKTIQNNTFSSWTGGTSTITAMSVNITGTTNATTGNSINNIQSAGSITGIATAAGNDQIYSNTINTLISAGAAGTTVSGISVTAGTVKNIYQNTIYDLQGNNITTGSVRGIIVSGGASVNVYQNAIYSFVANSITTGSISGIWVPGGTMVTVHRNKIFDLSSSGAAITSGTVNGIIVSGAAANSSITLRNNLAGDLRAPAANVTEPIRGISLISSGLNSTLSVYNNSIYLNAVSAGTNFGATGIYHLTSTTSTTAALDLRNNIIYNSSVPKGTGFAVAYRRSSATLTNYAATSNNNLFYAGLAATNRLIFYDGTNSDQLLSTYKTRVSPRETLSVMEEMITSSKFISTTGSSSFFLHLDSTKATLVESGAASVAGLTVDFDGQTRHGNSGYPGTGTAPDIGADETEGIKALALSGSYNVGTGETFTSLTNSGGLFSAINSLGLSGNVTINITSDLAEDGSNALNLWVEQGVGTYSLLIQPSAPTQRIISGNVLAGLIRLNGAKKVTIDGSNGTVNRYLTFSNTNTAGTTGTAFTFINGATNNSIRYCNVEAYANATNGVVLFGTSTVAGGNSSNTISNNSINATVSSNTGNVCIYSAGTAGKENSANTISNNIIYNFRDRALDITATGSAAWTISNNSFYNGDVAGSISYAAATTLHGIRILGGSGYAILNNYIGGNAALATGTSALYSSTAGNVSYQGILLTTSNALPASSIKGNTIATIAVSSVPAAANSISFIGIETNGSGISIGGTSTGDGNLVGSNTSNGSVSLTTTTATATFTSIIRGINCLSAGGVVTGNQVGGIDIKNMGAAPAPSAFIGIYVNNAAAPSQVNTNIIGSNGTGAATNSISVPAASASTATGLTGISIGPGVVSAIQLNGNIIQNINHQKAVSSTVLTGINTSAVTTATVSITNNIISGNATSAATGAFYGIFHNAANPASLTINNNTISGNTSAATTGTLYGIYTAGVPAPAVIVITNNIFSNNTNTASTGIFSGIYNGAATPSLSINSNTFYGNITSSTTGLFYPIYNAGAVTGTININSNNAGTTASPAITFNAANSGSQVFITNIAGTGTAALSINNNNFSGITYTVAGTGNNTYINNSAATLSQAINGNTFTKLNVNTTGNITFISNSVVVPATGTQNVNNNSISGTFTKAAGGTVTLFTSTATSVSGGVVNNNSNNFSNIIVSGSTVIAGWINTDAGAGTKTIQNNTFSNWTGGSGAITALAVNLTTGNNATTGNLVNNISGAAAITGISTGAGNDKIYSNVINTISSTGAAAVTAISVSGGTTKNIYKNKIYDINGSNAGSTVNGILVSGGMTVNVYNNLAGDLRTPNVSSATDAIRGISVTSTTASSAINIYYNTIYLNAVSTGTNFSSSGIYHVVNATATTAALNLRNNSITNTSTAKGTGVTVAYRRSGTALNNYAATSNNNLFYAGTPGTARLVFYDGTNADQLIANYKTRVSTRDALSVTENLTTKFLSVTGSSSLFLHMDDTQPSLIESGAVNIPGFADDADAQIRAGNPGYTGASSSPDIGADEIFGIESIPPVISYTLLSNSTLPDSVNVTGISITDASGINVAPGTKPRIYYKRFTDANAWLDNTSSTNGWKYTEATNSISPFTFTIDYSLLKGGAAGTAGVIQYFIVAEDLATTANTAVSSGVFAAAAPSVALTSSSFPVSGTINSYNIPFSGNYNIGTGEIFTTLTKADGLFAAVNTVGLAGNATFNIISDIAEDGSNALNQWVETGAGNYSLLIQPDGTTVRNISGNVPTGLIRLNGADRVTIDASNGGSGSYLSFENTNTAGTTGSAFTFINGAANNTIRYCDIKAYTNSTTGVILFSTSAVAGGNSNNLIDHNTINATSAGNTGNVAIYSSGTVGKENSANTISNNNIYNYRDRAIDITATGSTGWTISANSFFNGNVSGAISYAANTTLHGIRIAGGSGYSVSNNFIGGSTAQTSGSNAVYASTSGNISFQGILIATTSATPVSDITGNTIAGISLSSVPMAASSNAFTGIETNGPGINIGGSQAGEGNTVGSNTGNGSISFTSSTTSTTNTSFIRGIYSAGAGGSVNGNQVGGFDINNIGVAPASSFFQGIYVNNATAPLLVNNNIIGSTTTPDNIRVLSSSSATTTSLIGISIGIAVNSAMQVNGNAIQNISHLSTASSGTFTGIRNNAVTAAIITINNNIIKDVNTVANANSGSSAYTGIFTTGASAISNNVISNISLASTGTNAQITGINVSGAFVHIISGNTISGLSTASAKVNASAETGSPTNAAVIGILNAATVAGQEVSSNILLNFSSTTTNAINTTITGIGITASGSGNIFNNRVAGFTNTAVGAGPALCGILATNGSFNVYNNSIRLDNSGYINGIKIYGINHAASTNWNYYYNTVSISGNATGSAARSAAFIRPVSGTISLRNNIFMNIRTGTGSIYAISNIVAPPATNWSSTTSNNNDLYSSNANTTGEWGSASNRTFAQWKSISGGEANSVNLPVSFISSAYDLAPDSITNCVLDNAGTPINTPLTISTDINTISRNTSNPDPGAYEFTHISFAVSANNNSPVCAGTTVNFDSDAGAASNPVYKWTNASNVVVSTTRDPIILAGGGTYTVTVADSYGCSDSAKTIVVVNNRPTGAVNGTTSICNGNSTMLDIAVAGSGTINGALSNGDIFSGTAPVIHLTVSPTATAAYTITILTDAACVADPVDLTNTAIITVANDVWTGSNGTDWNDAANWCGGIPTSTTDAIIPSGIANYPLINATANVRNITIATGAFLSMSGSGILTISGSFSNGGTLANNGRIILNGTAAQSFPGSTATITAMNNLEVNNTAGVTINQSFGLTGTLTPTAGVIDLTSKTITLRSDVVNTANVAAVTGGFAYSAGGNFIVERYIPARRSWRLMTSPLTSTNTIYDSWQNGGTYTPGVGTFVSGPGGGGGLDTSNSYSLKKFNTATQGFVSVTNTNVSISAGSGGSADNTGYFIFIRGDRDPVNFSMSNKNNTTLRSAGRLQTGPQVFTAGSTAGSYALIGNPYASPVDFSTVSRTNIIKRFYVWDPLLNQVGGYVMLDDLDGDGVFAKTVSGSAQTKVIQSQQAFFVQTDLNGTATLTFNESNKSGLNNNLVFRPMSTPESLGMELFILNADSSLTLADGSMAEFNDNFSDSVRLEDAMKFGNVHEEIALLRHGSTLAMERRPLIKSSDTLFIKLSKTTQHAYRFKFTPANFNHPGLTAFLKDNYLGTTKPVGLDQPTLVNFTLTPDAASSAANRFMIVFKPVIVLPVTFTNIKAHQKNATIEVSWNVENELNTETYEVEKSTDGSHFNKVNITKATGNNNSPVHYNWLDEKAATGNNFYRIRYIDRNGKSGYSQTVRVAIGNNKRAISVYPNPLQGNAINLQFNNQPAGNYTIRLVNNAGQTVFTKATTVDGSNVSQSLLVPQLLAKGIYQLEITGVDNIRMLQQVMVQ